MANIKDILSKKVNGVEDETIALIDGHNIAYKTAHATIARDYSDNEEFVMWRQNFFMELFNIISEVNANRVVLVFDTKNSWRYRIYDDYKANRKKPDTSKKPLNKVAFNKVLSNTINDIREYFPNIHVMQIDQCEGDDIIAVLTKYVLNKPHQHKVVVSRDEDFLQLSSCNNVRQYDPLHHEYFTNINPKMSLEIKVLSGDISDNIKPIKKGVGPKTAAKIIAEGYDLYLDNIKTDEERDIVIENYKRNRQLIDFNFIPKDIEHKIVDEYNIVDSNIKPIDGKKVVKWLFSNKMNLVRNHWNTTSKYMSELR